MDLYSSKSRSLPQKLTITAIELLLVALSAWVMFGRGGELVAGIFGWVLPEGVPARRWVILAFSCVILCRMAFTMFVFLKRKIGWEEAVSVPMAFALYYLGFAVFVLPSGRALGLVDWIAVTVFAVGCWLNSASEFSRHRFKQDPRNAGKLYTRGLFSLSRHINYFGDVLWVGAYAVLADQPWAWLIPLFTFCFFAFYNAPALDRYLAGRYGEEYRLWAARTKMLVPFLW